MTRFARKCCDSVSRYTHHWCGVQEHVDALAQLLSCSSPPCTARINQISVLCTVNAAGARLQLAASMTMRRGLSGSCKPPRSMLFSCCVHVCWRGVVGARGCTIGPLSRWNSRCVDEWIGEVDDERFGFASINEAQRHLKLYS